MAEASTSKLQDVEAPSKPDRSGYNRIKRKYKALQLKYTDVQSDRSTLEKEQKAAEAKLAKLNAEISLILDQLEPEYADSDTTAEHGSGTDAGIKESSEVQEDGRPRTQSAKRLREDDLIEDSEADAAKRRRV